MQSLKSKQFATQARLSGPTTHPVMSSLLCPAALACVCLVTSCGGGGSSGAPAAPEFVDQERTGIDFSGEWVGNFVARPQRFPEDCPDGLLERMRARRFRFTLSPRESVDENFSGFVADEQEEMPAAVETQGSEGSEVEVRLSASKTLDRTSPLNTHCTEFGGDYYFQNFHLDQNTAHGDVAFSVTCDLPDGTRLDCQGFAEGDLVRQQ